MNIDGFLKSTHTFTKNEKLQEFRFKLLNSMMGISIFFASLHLLLISLGFLTQNFYFKIALFIYSVLGIGILGLLREQKTYYQWAVYFFIINSLVLFFFTLVLHPEDEFRLIAFFLASFSAFILMGKHYGVFISIFVFIMVLVFNQFFDLALSSMALSTFSSFFIIFSLFFYIFLQKIENDVLEFNHLHQRLEEKIEKEIKHRQEQEHMLLHQARLASMGEMIDSIAHQWRQPLMNINAILMNMNRSVEIKENPKVYIEKKIDEIAELTAYMSQTVDDFRVLLKDNTVKERFDIQILLGHTLELLSVPLQNISVQHNIKKSMMFYGHYSEFMQILMILLNNAMDVLNRRNIRNKEIFIEIEQREQYIILSVEDNAGGIQKSNLNRIFDPYFTTKEEQGGTGVGLYIAQLIVQKDTRNKLEVKDASKGAKFILSMFNEKKKNIF